MAEVVALGEVHIEHRHEGAADDEVEDPLEGHGDGYGSATDGVGEDLSDEHPADGAPREHERGGIDHDRGGSDKLQARTAKRESHAKGSESHAKGTPDEQRLAAPLLDGEYGHEREEDVDDAHEDGEHHRVVHAHVAEDARSIIEHGIDAHSLLEHREHDTHEDAEPAVSEKPLGLHGDSVLDVVENLLSLAAAVNLGEDAQGLLVLAHHDEVARCLRHKADEQREETGRDGLASEHIAPARGHCPLGVGVDGCQAFAHFLHEGLDVVTQDEEVDEIDNQLTEDDGKLVPRDKHAPDVRRSHLADIHGTDGGGQAYANAADDAVDIEHDEQRERGHAMLESHKLRIHAAQCGDEEKHTGQKERPLAAQTRGQKAGEGGADDAADERAAGGETVHGIGVFEVARIREEGLKTLLGTRDYGCVVAEEQAAKHGDHHDGNEVGFATVLSLIHFN